VSSLSFLFISDTGHHIVRRTAIGFLSAASTQLDE
jgi:hypothetical protein